MQQISQIKTSIHKQPSFSKTFRSQKPCKWSIYHHLTTEELNLCNQEIPVFHRSGTLSYELLCPWTLMGLAGCVDYKYVFLWSTTGKFCYNRWNTSRCCYCSQCTLVYVGLSKNKTECISTYKTTIFITRTLDMRVHYEIKSNHYLTMVIQIKDENIILEMQILKYS